FPRPQDDYELYLRHVNSYYHFRISSCSVTLGYVLPYVAEIFAAQPGWRKDDTGTPRTLTMVAGDDEASRSKVVAETLAAMRSTKKFEVLEGWRNERKSVFGPKGEVLFTIERSAVPLLGVMNYHVFMTAYTRSADNELRIWISRRAETKTYPHLLEVILSGGIAAGEKPYDTLIRDAKEEASLPEELLRSRVKSTGMVSWFEIRDDRAGGEVGLLAPEAHYVYDCELPDDVVPTPGDDEVEDFQLWTVEEVRQGLQRREFKPGVGHVILDFFVRHGIITEENDPDYVELLPRLHRQLEFPLRRGQRAGRYDEESS
ncbi:thiamine pyrophosphokinase-related protein, partial [Bisporella sp. PMI_857]